MTAPTPYLVLARKYRPSTLTDMVGQEHIVRTLQNAIAQGRVHHAFLFTGARGVGKTSMARILARALNCEQGPTATPCGTCSVCLEILAGRSADVLEIDGASNTGVDSVRELRDNVRYLPSHGRTKLYIIDEVHMLSQAAFNALLKTLEEPPPHVKFIFATTEPHKIPVTILSRCQRFDFRRVSVPALTEHIRHILRQESIALGAVAVAAVAREAQGSVRDALSLLDQVLSYGGAELEDAQVLEALGVVDRQTVFALCDAILARDAQAVLGQVATVDKRGHDLAQLATLLCEHLRDAAVIKHLDTPDAEIMERSQGEIQALQAQAKQRSHSDLQRLFRASLAVAEDVGRSGMPRVSLEMGLLRLLELAPATDLATVVQRLDALATATPAPVAPVSPPTALPAVAPQRPAPAAPPASPPVPPKAAPVATPSARPVVPASPPAAATPPPPPPPTSPAAVVPVAALAEQPVHHEAWRRFVDKVRAMRPAVASVLEHGRVLQYSPAGVELAFASNTFYWESARDSDIHALLVKLLAEQFGQPVSLKVVPLRDGMAKGLSLAEALQKEREVFEDGIKDSALEHEAVRGAVKILGAEIQQVRPLSPG